MESEANQEKEKNKPKHERCTFAHKAFRCLGKVFEGAFLTKVVFAWRDDRLYKIGATN